MGDVLFKPTLAAVEQFRPTFDEALSYFVASNNACPEDKGFAIKGWTSVRFENAGVILRERQHSQWGTTFSQHLKEMKSRWNTPLDTCLMKWERCESTSTTRQCRRPFEALSYTSGIRRLGIAKVRMKASRPKSRPNSSGLR